MNSTRPTLLCLSASLALLFGAMAPTRPAIAEISATQIMTKNFAASRVEDSVFDATFTLTSKGGSERVRKTVGMTKLQTNSLDQMRMTRFVAPSDVKGTSTLVLENSAKDDDIWVYLPALKKVRRLVSNNKKDSFLGTDFSYADVIGYPVANWKYSVLREETLDGEPCYVIDAAPQNESVKADSGYSKRIDWVRKSNYVTVKSEFWDEAGQPLKTAVFTDIKQVDPKADKWQAMRLEASNTQTGHRTVIQFDSFKVNQKVDEQIFTTRYMEKQ